MYIAHGNGHGNGHGTPELLAEWAQNNGIYQATFEPDRHRHGNQAAAERDRRHVDVNGTKSGIPAARERPRRAKRPYRMFEGSISSQG